MPSENLSFCYFYVSESSTSSHESVSDLKRSTALGPVWVYPLPVPVPSLKPLVVWPDVILL